MLLASSWQRLRMLLSFLFCTGQILSERTLAEDVSSLMIDSHDLSLKNFVVRTVVVSDFKSNISLCIYLGKFPKCWL